MNKQNKMHKNLHVDVVLAACKKHGVSSLKVAAQCHDGKLKNIGSQEELMRHISFVKKNFDSDGNFKGKVEKLVRPDLVEYCPKGWGGPLPEKDENGQFTGDIMRYPNGTPIIHE